VIGGRNTVRPRPDTGRIVVIEINPRTSRSSPFPPRPRAFRSPSSRQSGGRLHPQGHSLLGEGTLDQIHPWGDYVVIKFARWALRNSEVRRTNWHADEGRRRSDEHRQDIQRRPIRRRYAPLEIKRYGLGFAANFNQLSLDELMRRLVNPPPKRQFLMYEALRKGATLTSSTRKRRSALVHFSR